MVPEGEEKKEKEWKSNDVVEVRIREDGTMIALDCRL